MSIIYDALKKTQKNLDGHKESLESKQEIGNKLDVLIAIVLGFLVLALLVVCGINFFSTSKHHTASALGLKNIKSVNTSNKKFTPFLPSEIIAYKNKHDLNGIFISENEKIAMINNHFFNIGEVVDGLKIVSIDADHITLKGDRGAIILRIKV